MKQCFYGLFFIFLCSCTGFAFIFFAKKSNKSINNFFVGFSTGVMLAASIWSLLIPALENTQNIFIVVTGFVFGCTILIVLNLIFVSLGKKIDYIDKMYLTLSVHNIPEGLLVGMSYGYCLLTGNFINGHLMAFAIGVQNIPESIAVSIPLYNKERKLWKTLIKIFMSAFIEPIFGLIGFLFVSYINGISNFILSFAAGNMIYVVVSELIPEFNKEKKNSGEIGFICGFIIMMIFDVIM